MGLGGIDTLEKLARLKATVPERCSRNGYAILNAEDDLAYKMRKELDCKIALYSLDPNNRASESILQKGGLAAVYEGGYITIIKGGWKIRVEQVKNIPITFSGIAEFNVANVLAATLAVYVRDFKIEDIKLALQTFVPGAALTPGRMNVFHFKNYTVMLDYAHNTHGMQALGKMIKHVDATYKCGHHRRRRRPPG